MCPTVNSDDIDHTINLVGKKSTRNLPRYKDDTDKVQKKRANFAKGNRRDGRRTSHPDVICSIEYDDGMQVDLCFAQNLIPSSDESSF